MVEEYATIWKIERITDWGGNIRADSKRSSWVGCEVVVNALLPGERMHLDVLTDSGGKELDVGSYISTSAVIALKAALDGTTLQVVTCNNSIYHLGLLTDRLAQRVHNDTATERNGIVSDIDKVTYDFDQLEESKG